MILISLGVRDPNRIRAQGGTELRIEVSGMEVGQPRLRVVSLVDPAARLGVAAALGEGLAVGAVGPLEHDEPALLRHGVDGAQAVGVDPVGPRARSAGHLLGDDSQALDGDVLGGHSARDLVVVPERVEARRGAVRLLDAFPEPVVAERRRADLVDDDLVDEVVRVPDGCAAASGGQVAVGVNGNLGGVRRSKKCLDWAHPRTVAGPASVSSEARRRRASGHGRGLRRGRHASGLQVLTGSAEHALDEIRIRPEALAKQRLDLWAQRGDEASLLRDDQQPQHTGNPQAQRLGHTPASALVDDQSIGVDLES